MIGEQLIGDLSGVQRPWSDNARDLWLRSVDRAVRSLGVDQKMDPAGDPRLRVTLAQELGVAAEELIITSGVRSAAMSLLSACDSVAFEQPTFGGVIRCLKRVGVKVYRVSLDDLDGYDSRMPLWITQPARNPDGRCWNGRTPPHIISHMIRGTRVLINGTNRWYCDHSAPPADANYLGSLHKLAGPGARIGWATIAANCKVQGWGSRLVGSGPPPQWQRAWAYFIETGGIEMLRRERCDPVAAARESFIRGLNEYAPADLVGCGPWILLDTTVHEDVALGLLENIGLHVNRGSAFFAGDSAIVLNVGFLDHEVALRFGKAVGRTIGYLISECSRSTHYI